MRTLLQSINPLLKTSGCLSILLLVSNLYLTITPYISDLFLTIFFFVSVTPQVIQKQSIANAFPGGVYSIVIMCKACLPLY